MKNYASPSLELISISADDVITTSPGTEGPVVDYNGPGDLDISF